MEVFFLLGISACVIALILISVKRAEQKQSIETRPEPERLPDKVQILPQKQPPADPVVMIYEDRQYRAVRQCPGCDGESPAGVTVCCICGRKL